MRLRLRLRHVIIYLFFKFKGAVRNPDYRLPASERINESGRGSRQSWPNIRNDPDIRLEVLKTGH